MNLAINGEPYVLRNGDKLRDLINELGINPERVAILVNEEIVPRDKWERLVLREGDAVEFVTLMGGGRSE